MLPHSIKNLINHLSSLPGIGPRQATRLAFYILRNGNPAGLGQSLLNLRESVKTCPRCHITFEARANREQKFCHICSDNKRDQKTIAVVAEETDIYPLERTGLFSGVYHVLGGLVSPYKNIQPKNLRIKNLLSRLKNKKEIIIALNPTTEGDATAFHLKRLLSSNPQTSKIKITRLGRGLPTGLELEYADEQTLRNSLEHRTS